MKDNPGSRRDLNFAFTAERSISLTVGQVAEDDQVWPLLAQRHNFAVRLEGHAIRVIPVGHRHRQVRFNDDAIVGEAGEGGVHIARRGLSHREGRAQEGQQGQHEHTAP
ncbi:MAG: hypothetical protein L6R45_29095 [Anaerolineae bacterium]|nr:hypothetical protein [Anaerolineae bacterium]